MRISLADLHRVYDSLDVHFEKWLGESDADPYIPAMVADLKAKGLAVPSEGAWVIPVAEPGDKKEIPPVILVKSDGSSIYATTDLAPKQATSPTSGRTCTLSRFSGPPGRRAS